MKWLCQFLNIPAGKQISWGESVSTFRVLSLIVAAFTEAALQIRELFSIRPLFSALTI